MGGGKYCDNGLFAEHTTEHTTWGYSNDSMEDFFGFGLLLLPMCLAKNTDLSLTDYTLTLLAITASTFLEFPVTEF